MIKLIKEVHQHSLEVEDSLATVPENVASPKTIERTFGIMGSALLAGGFWLGLSGVESAVHRTNEFVDKQEASIIDVAKVGFVDPLLVAGGGFVAFVGLEDIAVANGIRRRRSLPNNTSQPTNSGQ